MVVVVVVTRLCVSSQRSPAFPSARSPTSPNVPQRSTTFPNVSLSCTLPLQFSLLLRELRLLHLTQLVHITSRLPVLPHQRVYYLVQCSASRTMRVAGRTAHRPAFLALGTAVPTIIFSITNATIATTTAPATATTATTSPATTTATSPTFALAIAIERHEILTLVALSL